MTLVLALTLIVPAFYPVDPFDIVWGPLAPPGDAPEIPLGSDFVGRDVLAGIIHGGRATLAVGASAALITVVIGISIGAGAGFYGGFVDEMLMRLTEFFQVLPALLFAMVLVSLFSQSLTTIAIAIGGGELAPGGPDSPGPSSSRSRSWSTSRRPGPSAPATGASSGG